MTDTVHGNARISRISAQRIESTLAQGSVAIVAGFQGVSQETKEITTLGRGGSDLTAIALAGHLKAASCQLYKDVDGVYEADPRLVPQARKIDQISWNTMLEMAWSGASVLHSRGAHLAARFEIPVEIRSSFNLNKLGTIVSGKAQMEKFVVEAISQKENMCILSGTIPGNKTNTLNDLRAWLWEKGETSPVQFQHYQSNETSFQWLLPANLAVQAKKLLEAEKGDDFQITPCGVLTIVGSGFWQSPEIIPSIQEDIKCPLLMDIKNCTITLAVESSALKKQMVTLHEKLMLHKSQKK
jgi:aspartate kinase